RRASPHRRMPLWPNAVWLDRCRHPILSSSDPGPDRVVWLTAPSDREWFAAVQVGMSNEPYLHEVRGRRGDSSGDRAFMKATHQDTVLVVEDDSDTLDSIRELLEEEGYA